MIQTQKQTEKRINTFSKDGKSLEILETYNLSKFKFMEGNRVPNLNHVRRLEDSIRLNGMLINPIIVNEKYQVIDGQHRLMAAQKTASKIYYIILKGYKLKEVHALNINQKNWTKKDFLEGYANMNIESYVKLREFVLLNNEFTINSCITFCSQSGAGSYDLTNVRKDSRNKNFKTKMQIFEEGTWRGKSFELGQEWANRLKEIGAFYDGYKKTSFINCMVYMFKHSNFNFNLFIKKLKIQKTKLVDCGNSQQYKDLIEDIYNYKNKNKVNLRFNNNGK